MTDRAALLIVLAIVAAFGMVTSCEPIQAQITIGDVIAVQIKDSANGSVRPHP